MKECKKCSTLVRDTDKFCPKCGFKMEETVRVSNLVGNSPQSTYEISRSFASGNAASVNVRQLLGHPLLLTAIIGFTLFTFIRMMDGLSILSTLNKLSAFGNSLINDIAVAFEIKSENVEMLITIVKLFVICEIALPIIMAIGMWIVFYCAKNRYYITLKTSGLSLMSVFSTASAVWGLILALLNFFVALKISNDDLVYNIIAFVFQFVFYIKLRGVLNNIIYSVENEVIIFDISLFVGIGSFVLAGFQFISLLNDSASLTDGDKYVYSAISYCAALVMFGVWVFIYRNRMMTVKAQIERMEYEARNQRQTLV